MLELHAARPGDLTPYSTAFIVSGSLVVRAEYAPGRALDALPIAPPRSGAATIRTVKLPNLPSLAGLLVQQGDSVTEGQPLARYVDDATPAQHRQDALSADSVAARARASIEQEQSAYTQRSASQRQQMQAAQQTVTTWTKLVQQDAATRVELQGKAVELARVQEQVTSLTVSHTSTLARLTQQEADARAWAAQARAAALKAEVRQIVRSPAAGKVAQIRAGDTTAAGVSVEIVLIVQDAETLRAVAER